MCHHPTVLIHGHDAMLLDTRRWVLERAGFRVFTTAEPQVAREIMTDHAVDMLLLCHTLSHEQRATALAEATALQPAMRRLVMVKDTQEAAKQPIEGDTLHSFAGAEGLIAATRRLTNQKSKGEIVLPDGSPAS